MPLPGARHAGYLPTANAAWVAIAAAALVLAGAAITTARWVRARGWSPRHTIAAVTAALIAHTLIGLGSLVHTTLDRTALGAFGLLELALLIALARHHTSIG